MKKATKKIYIEYLKQEISELEELQHDGDMMHAIYIIDDIIVGGDFYDGIRSNDHNCLLEIDYSDYSQYIYYNGERYTIKWDDVLSWGVVIVPESQTYISDDIVIELDDLGYERLPLNDNHIAGFKQ